MMCSPLGGEDTPLKSLKQRARKAPSASTMAEDDHQSAKDILAELERRRSAALPVFKDTE